MSVELDRYYIGGFIGVLAWIVFGSMALAYIEASDIWWLVLPVWGLLGAIAISFAVAALRVKPPDGLEGDFR